jgi:hypothetical protein
LFKTANYHKRTIYEIIKEKQWYKTILEVVSRKGLGWYEYLRWVEYDSWQKKEHITECHQGIDVQGNSRKNEFCTEWIMEK